MITALLSEPTYAAAAAKAGVSVATLYRWLKLPEFLDAWREARRASVDLALGLLQAGLAEAVITLREALDAPTVSDRIRAADVFLKHALKAVDQLDTLERLKQIEEQLAAYSAESNALPVRLAHIS